MLKEYQDFVLEKLDNYLKVLREEYFIEKNTVEFHKRKGIENTIKRYCQETWDKLYESGHLPTLRDKNGQIQAPNYLNKKDGLGNIIPNICLKVPTGGGKTLLGVCAVERINANYFSKTTGLPGTGLVLWIVPTDAIYQQTIKNFKNKSHNYRKVFERASAGRVKILEKTDAFSRQDLQEYLCVMVIMLQSTNREKTKEYLKVFKDSGHFMNFFHPSNDHPQTEKLLAKYPNLDWYGDEIKLGGFKRRYIKQSLGNAIRLTRPIVVLDEGHRAYSQKARDTLTGLNPKFILELSATPQQHLSNVLVNVSGLRLKEEEMIKMPINLTTLDRTDWKKTLCLAYDQLKDLEQHAKTYHHQSQKYIRPIMLIQVERTSEDQQDKKFIHAENVRKYLVETLGVDNQSIRAKTAEKNELKDENLLSNTSPVKFILTKQALQEGWDCPFAYVLVILANTQSKTALTQLIGRILRQPYAKSTPIKALNESYVFCYNQAVSDVVSGITKGLQQEGMDDLVDHIKFDNDQLTRQTIPRRKQFKDTSIFLPRVLHKDMGAWRPIIYEADILRHLDFSKLSYNKGNAFLPANLNAFKSSHIQLDIGQDQESFIHLSSATQKRQNISSLDFTYMVKRLSNIIPNPWQAARILEETIKALKLKGISEEQIHLNKAYLIDAMERDLQDQIYQQSENLFKEKLTRGEVCFKIFKNSIDLNWKMAHNIDFLISKEDQVLRRRNAEPLQLTLFEKTYEKHYNHFEKNVAWYLDEDEAVKYWHRMIAKTGDYHIQGWQKRKVYPDFLACIDESHSQKTKLSVLETKGEHLKGNEDTKYKDKLFGLLEQYANNPTDFGTVETGTVETGTVETGTVETGTVETGTSETASKEEEKMIFKILMERNWKEKMQIIHTTRCKK